MTPVTFTQALAQRHIMLSDLQQQQFADYADFLVDWNQRINLTSITELNDIYEKHFYDCILAWQLAQIPNHSTVADISSGAGFPGVVFKIIDPTLTVTLIEPTGKKCDFLTSLIEKLQLSDISVNRNRAEEYYYNNKKRFDTVTARAVAPFNVLLELCAPLVSVGGQFVALKGPKAVSELQDAQSAYEALGLKAPRIDTAQLSDGSQRLVITFPKVKPGQSRYPRPYAQIKKKPLYAIKEDSNA